VAPNLHLETQLSNSDLAMTRPSSETFRRDVTNLGWWADVRIEINALAPTGYDFRASDT